MPVLLRFALALVLFLLCLPPALAASDSDIWAEREQARYTAERQALIQRQQQALAAREKALSAQQYSRQINDTQAMPVADKAVATAEAALERIRKALERTDARLDSVERLRATASTSARAVASTVRGEVQVKTASGWEKLTPQSVLGPGQQIRTGADGFAEVSFLDGSRINLHANSSFQLVNENGELSNYELSLGHIKAKIERLAQRRFAVRTPTAIVGVRGTEFLLETTVEGASALVVLHGEVEFGPAEKETRISVRQGERAILSADGTLRGPEVIDLKTLQPWWD